jgi:DNA modification methylase
MDAWHQDARATIYHGDCLEVLRALPDASVDAVVTDPPYGLEFMGKDWDRPWAVSASNGVGYAGRDDLRLPAHRDSRNANCRTCGGRQRGAKRCTCDTPKWDRNPADDMREFQAWAELWAAECLRVLKPGGHLLAFGGTRTWHRLACAIEDAGFEVRDSIAWMYGSGFPKSLDVSKAIDKARDDRPDILRVTSEIARLRDLAGLTNRDLDDAFGFAGMAGHWTSTKSQPAVPRLEQWAVLRDMLNPDPWLDEEVWRLNGRKGTPGEAWGERKVVGSRTVTGGEGTAAGYANGIASVRGLDITEKREVPVTAPATPAAREWSGWGTALKPAHEPIVVARKPLVGTVAANVLEHGTGALNIDACRIQHDAKSAAWVEKWSGHEGHPEQPGWGSIGQKFGGSPAGRWPANVVLDEDQAAELDRQSGYTKDGTTYLDNRTREYDASGYLIRDNRTGTRGYNGGGGASRFFYVAKAPARERPKVDGTAHPTVKPLTLMRWLCRLVTPPNGVILEPFAGSGTTVEAALLEGFRVVAIEREADYLPLIQARLDRVAAQEPEDEQLTLDASA